jgi:hypothetical protein
LIKSEMSCTQVTLGRLLSAAFKRLMQRLGENGVAVKRCFRIGFA